MPPFATKNVDPATIFEVSFPLAVNSTVVSWLPVQRSLAIQRRSGALKWAHMLARSTLGSQASASI